MVDGLQMILEFLAADRDAMLDDQVGFGLGERVSLDGIRRIGELEIGGAFELGQRRGRPRAEAVELRLLV